MKIVGISGFATITDDPTSSAALYRDVLNLPLKSQDSYLYMSNVDGAKHFGVWPLQTAAQHCFGSDVWPSDLPIPQATIEFELSDIPAVEAAVIEMKESGYHFVHEARLEPWGQTLARFISPEGLLIGLSYAPWHHKDESGATN
ncbi:MAG: glyoxalase [Cyanothece sp. SIO2G6]|nr:glyoxalase [Cyanothece sp. SIO2G6]